MDVIWTGDLTHLDGTPVKPAGLFVTRLLDRGQDASKTSQDRP